MDSGPESKNLASGRPMMRQVDDAPSFLLALMPSAGGTRMISALPTPVQIVISVIPIGTRRQFKYASEDWRYPAAPR